MMPVTEHPFYGSWGYQTTGYLRRPRRYGSRRTSAPRRRAAPARIGVIRDWCRRTSRPTARPRLLRRDLPLRARRSRQGFHPEWKSSIFNYDRHEVRAFLLSFRAVLAGPLSTSTACAWTASPRCCTSTTAGAKGEWIPNAFGGRENRAAVGFLRQSERGGVPRPSRRPGDRRGIHVGADGVASGLPGRARLRPEWNMGWMHDTPTTCASRRSSASITRPADFSIWYAFFENFVLALSHDEVVHGKGSLVGKMPAGHLQQFANLRLLYGLHVGPSRQEAAVHGGEFGQRANGRTTRARMVVLPVPRARRSPALGRGLNALLRAEPALHQSISRRRASSGSTATTPTTACSPSWRRPRAGPPVLVVCNFTPLPRANYVRRRAPGRLLAGAAQQRRHALRRQRHGQPGRGRGGAGAGAGAFPFARRSRCRRGRALPQAR